MKSIQQYNSKATVCTGSGTCITVYGKVAQLVQAAVLAVAVVALFTAISKALK